MEKQRLRVYKTEINGRGDALRWPRDTLYPQNVALISPAGCGRSVGIVRLQTKATEFFYRVVDTGTGYGLDDRGLGVRVPVG
jgi:hypothetical protein